MKNTAEKYFLYLGPKAPAEVSWAEQPEYGSLTSGQGSLQDAATILGGREVVVIVPGPEVLLTEVTVPRHHHRLLLESIPYLLEESLAEDVERLHFASGRPDQQSVAPVAVVSRERMDSWLTMLKEHAISAEQLVPAPLAVPLVSGQWSLVLSGASFLLRKDLWQAWGGDSSNLHRYLAENDPPNETGTQLFIDPSDPAPPELTDSLTISAEIQKSLIEVLVEGHDPGTSLDLLQGEYSRRAQWRELWQKWRLPLVAAVLITILAASSSLFEYFDLQKEANNLDRQIRTIYLKSFPSSRKIINPRVQMEQKLVELQKTSGRQGSFFTIYDKISRLLTKAPGFTLNILRYKDNRFEFDFEVQDLQTLDKLKEQLTAVPEIMVEIKKAESSGNIVKARIQIKPGGEK